MNNIAVIILTYNESIHLARALKNVEPIAKEVFVIDSFSSDDTVAIATAHGAQVFQHAFINYSKQFQWALEHAPITAEWVMRLDADEIVEPDLVNEIAEILQKLPIEVTGINLRRKTIFLGRWIKYGGRFPLILLRIWRHGMGRIENRWMDEHILLSQGHAITLNGGFSDYNLNNLSFFTDKHNKYATREAIDVINHRRKLFFRDVALEDQMASRQAAMKRLLKEKLYNRIPYELSSLAYFLHRYLFQLGFLDGREGFAYHVLQGYWYRFLVGAKVRELETYLGNSQGDDAIQKLQAVTGIKVGE